MSIIREEDPAEFVVCVLVVVGILLAILAQ